MKAKIWYLYHSGFAVRTVEHFLIFDYWRTTPSGGGLDNGVIDITELRNENVVVFASHGHPDHFAPVILRWHEAVPKLRLVLSDDIKVADNAFIVGPGMTLEQPDMTVHTLASNDEGVAFIVEVDGMIIYHAGDLNWWHWEGEPLDENEEMAASYRSQMDILAGYPIDIAFVPLDPRLEDQYAWGIDYLMRTVDVRNVVPMHFGDKPGTVERFLQDSASVPYRDKVISLTKRGESAEI